VDTLWMIVGAVAGLGLSFWLGYRYGEKCRKLPERRYWTANVVGMLVGLVLAVLGSQYGMPWLWAMSLGIMTGSISGLKYGLGKSVGIWRLMDGAKHEGKR
jgi:hypothetical protein